MSAEVDSVVPLVARDGDVEGAPFELEPRMLVPSDWNPKLSNDTLKITTATKACSRKSTKNLNSELASYGTENYF